MHSVVCAHACQPVATLKLRFDIFIKFGPLCSSSRKGEKRCRQKVEAKLKEKRLRDRTRARRRSLKRRCAQELAEWEEETVAMPSSPTAYHGNQKRISSDKCELLSHQLHWRLSSCDRRTCRARRLYRANEMCQFDQCRSTSTRWRGRICLLQQKVRPEDYVFPRFATADGLRINRRQCYLRSNALQGW